MNQIRAMCRPAIYWLLVFALSVGSGLATYAQAPDIDAWMQRHFSGKPGVKQDPKADEALYASLGLDSLRSNRFIGSVSGTITLPGGGSPVKLVLWCDTLEAIMRLQAPGDTTTYTADLRTNTITIVATSNEAGEVDASINDLRERVLVNWYRHRDDGAPWRIHCLVPYDRDGGILGQDMQRWAAVKGDTIHFTRFGPGIGLSPFVDALEWLPYGGDYPFNVIMQLARAGDKMPKQFRSSAGHVELQIMALGPHPPPQYAEAITVVDTRGKGHHTLPIRRSNRRYTMGDLAPVSPKHEGEGQGMSGTPDGPDNPEVTYAGARPQMRLFEKLPCGEVGTVVVNVWIDPKGIVQRAEVDKAKSTLKAQACFDNALEAAQKDTFHPLEGAMPLEKGVLTFEYKASRGGDGPGPGDRSGSGSGNGDGRGSGSANGLGDAGGSGPGGSPGSRGPFSYELQGRTIASKAKMEPSTDGSGKVVMDIWVDRTGKVQRAEPGRGTTTTAENLIKTARKAAMETRFSANPEAPEEQQGRVTFVFRIE